MSVLALSLWSLGMVTPAWTGNLYWRLGAVTLTSAPQKALDPQAAGWAIGDPVSCHMPELNTTSQLRMTGFEVSFLLDR